MSRIGKLPITLPAGVTFSWEAPVLKIEGPKGTLTRTIHKAITVSGEDNTLKLAPVNPKDPSAKALWGLFRSLVYNMVVGVSTGYSKILEVVGVGWKVDLESPEVLRFALGFSHPVIFELPKGVSCKVEPKAGRLTLESIDKELLGETAASIRRYRPPEPYKGKGIRYQGEVLRHKVGKAGAK